jgi:hypothetical protein
MRLFMPVNIGQYNMRPNMFVYSRLPDPAKRLTMDFVRPGIGGKKLSVFIERTEKRLSPRRGAKSLKIGKNRGFMTEDRNTGEVCVMFKNGPAEVTVFATNALRDRLDARAEALRAAKILNEWADVTKSWSPKTRTAHLSAFRQAAGR